MYEPTDMRLEHFECAYNLGVNYRALADNLYNGPRILVFFSRDDIMVPYYASEIIHFQGLTNLSVETFYERLRANDITIYKRYEDPVWGFEQIQHSLNYLSFPHHSRGFTFQETEAFYEQLQCIPYLEALPPCTNIAGAIAEVTQELQRDIQQSN